LRVRGFLRSSSSDRPRVFGGQSATGGQSEEVADRSADLLDRIGVFRLEVFFVRRTVRACLPDSPSLPWRTVRGS
jgi:hypothetical protein